MNLLSHALLKTGLAVLFAVGLSPLADAHTCQPGVYSVDPGHRVPIFCDDFFCIVVAHVCYPPPAGAALAPELLQADGLLALP